MILVFPSNHEEYNFSHEWKLKPFDYELWAKQQLSLQVLIAFLFPLWILIKDTIKYHG